MQPDERPTLSTPAPQIYMPSAINSPHTPRPENEKYVTDREPTPPSLPPSNTPKKRGGGIFMVLLILILLGSTGTFAFLWYRQRQTVASQTTMSPTPTPVQQAQEDNMQVSQLFSQFDDGKQKQNLVTSITVPTSYRVQSELNPWQLELGTSGRALWSLHLADGYQEKPTGARVGSITAVDLQDWLKADDVTESGTAGTLVYSLFGGPYKAAQKQAMVTNLEVLLAAKDTDVKKFLPSATNKVLFPFTTNASAVDWAKPDLISRDGWTGYTTIGQMRQNIGYSPHMYAVMLTKVKDVTGSDRKLLVFADITLKDTLALKSTGELTSVADEIKTATAAIEKDGKYGDEATKMYKKLQEIINSLKVSVN